ncbi:MAG: DUF1295 domain-containing protein [Planctomycetes bacterium]|nr:DUF1295 domain-containing protein [Planctomycetota bacterium]
MLRDLLRPDLLLLAWGIAAAAFLLLWVRQRSTGDATPVDVAWSAGLGCAAVLHASLVEAPAGRRLLVAGLAGAWSLRLTLHLVRDRLGRGEDGRYRRLREEKGEGAQAWFLVFFQAQALLVALLSVPYLAALTNPRRDLGPADAAGAALVLAAVAGEWAADRRLAAFRADPANRGRTCRSGLWALSRHPNYFFQWLGWCAWPLLALGSPAAWAAAAAPALMLLLILRVTGIPPAEARALATRGEDYRAYQRTVPAFFPWFPRRSEP